MQHRAATLCTDVLQCLTLQSRVSLSIAKPKTHTAVKHTKRILNIAVKKQCLKCAVQNKAVTQTMLEVCSTEQSCNSVIVQHSNVCRPSTNKRKPLHRKQRLKKVSKLRSPLLGLITRITQHFAVPSPFWQCLYRNTVTLHKCKMQSPPVTKGMKLYIPYTIYGI